ncbi:MAG: hypothetical protein ABSF91_08320 [Bacteroidota bacterium]|jgi:uncharacterized small protein (DUF1192 family)
MDKTHIDLRELGYLQGKILADTAKDSKEIEQQVLENLSEEKRKHHQKLASLKVRLEFLDKAIHLTDQRIAQLRQEIERLWKDRMTNPAQYALLKGLFYLLLAVLMILADVPVLGRAAQHFIPDIPWRDEEGTPFTQILFSNPANAWRSFPDLLLLVLAILCLGLFTKPWLDSVTAIDSQAQKTRTERVLFVIISILFVLSVLTVGAMAYVRYDQAGDDRVRGVVTALMGFALPFISAGFFMKAYPILANRLNHLSFSVRARIQTWWLEYRGKKREKLYMEIEEHDQILRERDLPAYASNLIALSQAEYADGYADGFSELLRKTDGRTLFQKLTPIALRRISSRRIRRTEQ